ncbi:hypothetical protein HQ520_09650 [bacterium]|nr:hypothetical protein [bacterium]
MKKMIALIAMVALMALIALPAMAGTLYEQEEDPVLDNDPVEVNAAGVNAAADANWTNWKHQYGSGSWSGVYAASAGWVTADESGDMDLAVEADVEMYFTQSVSNNKIYFHLGNIYAASSADKIAYVDGSFTTNNGQYIGISFLGTGKAEADFENIGGAYTGKVLGGMQSDHDTWRTQDNEMDVEILLNAGAGWEVPVNYGDGAHSTITDTLWWLVNGGAPGSYNYQWRVKLLPTADQPDGDYYLDPVVVAAPIM